MIHIQMLYVIDFQLEVDGQKGPKGPKGQKGSEGPEEQKEGSFHRSWGDL